MAPVNLEAAFLDDLRDHPAEVAPWLILADWLEDQGDPRAELVRLTLSLRTEPEHLEFDSRQRRVQKLIAEGLRPVVPLVTNSIGMQLALIPAGSFIMGSDESDPDHETDEAPPHRVHISRSFYLGVYPVLQAEYIAVRRENPSHFVGLKRPVENVSWHVAVEYCRMLSALPGERNTGWTYRLPTEAEWEYACRAGTTTRYHFGDEGLLSLANMDTEDGSTEVIPRPLMQTCEVGRYLPNAWGLFDMHGNVWEWCSDWFAHYKKAEQTDPQGPRQASFRSMRGGGWNSWAQWCRSSRRSNTGPDSCSDDRGFRVVAVPPSQEAVP